MKQYNNDGDENNKISLKDKQEIDSVRSESISSENKSTKLSGIRKTASLISSLFREAQYNKYFFSSFIWSRCSKEKDENAFREKIQRVRKILVKNRRNKSWCWLVLAKTFPIFKYVLKFIYKIISKYLYAELLSMIN